MRIVPAKPSQMGPILRYLFRRQRRIYGQELIAAKVWARVPALFLAFARCFSLFSRKRSPLDATLRSRVSIRVSQTLQCPFCVDFNSYLLLKRSSRTSVTPADEAALAYAEAMCAGPVPDPVFASLRSHFSEEAIVELTALIALQLASSHFNIALQIPSQSLCPLPSDKNGV